jgi:glycosyltransferase involved in cell wall biosynthesis
VRTLVFIPAWNEADSVAAVIAGVRERLPEADVLVVDDGSTDATTARAREAGATVASLPFNQGLGAALQTGYLYALREGYDFCAHLDADGQHPPADVARLLEEVCADRADLVIGSRYRERRAASGASEGGEGNRGGRGSEGAREAGPASGGAAGEAGADDDSESGADDDNDDYKPTISRRIGTSVFRFFLTLATRQRFTDTTSGMRAANRRVMALFSQHYSPDFAEIESLQLAVRQGLRVEEVPVRMLERAGGASFLTPLRSAFFIFKGLIVLLVGQFRPRKARGSGDDGAFGAGEASGGEREEELGEEEARSEQTAVAGGGDAASGAKGATAAARRARAGR